MTDLIHNPKDFMPDIEKFYHDGFPQGLSTGFPLLDKHFKVFEGTLNLITGTPGSGKSTWLDQMLINIMQANHEMYVAMFTPESAPYPIVTGKL